jgi:uncharacterized DUF497 family protein
VDDTPLYAWDEGKRVRNLALHKVDFTTAENFEWNSAHVEVDDREDYGELREIAWGFIGVRLYVLVFTRRDDLIWIISLRPAQKRDARKYEEAIRRRMA